VSELLQIAMPSGGVIWARVDLGSVEAHELKEIEVSETVEVGDDLDDAGGITDVGVRTLLRKVKKLTDFKETIRSVALSVHESFAELPDETVPDKVSVEFSIEISGKSGQLIGVLAEAGAKAAIKVNVEWHDMTTRVAAGK